MSTLRTTSIYTLPTGGALYAHGPLSPLMTMTDEGEQIVPGYICVNTIPAGYPLAEDVERMVIHAAVGAPPLEGMTVIVDGSETPWDPDMVAAAWPNASLYVLRGAWLVDGERVDGWMIEYPEGAEMIEAGVVPHGWA